jgi:hypothetical protein
MNMRADWKTLLCQNPPEGKETYCLQTWQGNVSEAGTKVTRQASVSAPAQRYAKSVGCSSVNTQMNLNCCSSVPSVSGRVLRTGSAIPCVWHVPGRLYARPIYQRPVRAQAVSGNYSHDGEEDLDYTTSAEFAKFTDPMKMQAVARHLDFMWQVSQVHSQLMIGKMCVLPRCWDLSVVQQNLRTIRHSKCRLIVVALEKRFMSCLFSLQRKRPAECDCCNGSGETECIWCHGTGTA